ncbi:MAG: hypothetical protein MUO72_02345 [Bacteroidales bacterium]|nr:hypothetical protein [Bacteroidales bacterium]
MAIWFAEIKELDCKGWGLYKQGKNEEALDMLQKSWDLRRKLEVSLKLPNDIPTSRVFCTETAWEAFWC